MRGEARTARDEQWTGKEGARAWGVKARGRKGWGQRRTGEAAHRAETEAPAQSEDEQARRLGGRDRVAGGGDEAHRDAAAYHEYRCHGAG